MTDIAIIIPARYASTRFPAKPLAPLRGASGQVKSLLQRSVGWARRCRGYGRAGGALCCDR